MEIIQHYGLRQPLPTAGKIQTLAWKIMQDKQYSWLLDTMQNIHMNGTSMMYL